MGELCIRDQDGRICAWLVGMSEDEITGFLDKYPGTHRSVSVPDEWGRYR